MPLSLEEENTRVWGAIANALQPPMTEKHFQLYPFARKSSHPGALTMAQVTQNLVLTENEYNNMLNDPFYQNVREGQRPGGAGTLFRSHRTVIARHGTRPVPTHTGNVDDPSLIAFINDVDQILNPANAHARPIEIHFLCMGLAGFSVDASAWGNRTEGFLHKLLTADAAMGTQFARNTYLVFLLEMQVVDPQSPWSINPNRPPDGARKNNKQVIKVSLLDLSDRNMALKTHADSIGIGFNLYMYAAWALSQGLAGPPGFPVGVFPPGFYGGPAEALRLDSVILAMWWEHAWRSGWLDAMTSPTDAMIAASNHSRNATM